MTCSDRDLLASHMAGDQRAFPELVERQRGRLWTIARGALDSPEDAAEAVQDALVRAHQGAARFRGESTVATWLVRILINVCMDRRRHNRVRAAIPMAMERLEELPSPRDPIGDAETSMDVWAAMDALPPEQRLPIIMVEMNGYSMGEAAQVLGIPVGTVKSRCSRGRARLHSLLAEVPEVVR
jgi:RNA polymerase sigma-70 factor (ECF subfamily)